MGIKITNLTKTYQQVLCTGVIGDFSNDEDNNLDQIIVDDFEKTFNRLDKKLPVHFYLNSFGGSLIDARQMMNIMENYKNNGGVIKVIVPYVAASCATLLALSGNELIYDEDGLFLIHSVYYDPSSFSEKYKLDEKTLNSLQQDIKEQNDFLADFYSKKSTKSSEDYRALLSEAKDIILKPEEMKNDYGFDLDIINSVLESEKYSVNKFSKNLNDDELHKTIKNATTLGFIKDFKLKNFVEDTAVENKLLGDDKKLPNDLKDTKTQNLKTNTGKLEKMALSENNSNETPDSKASEKNGNNNPPEKTLNIPVGMTQEEVNELLNKAKLEAQAEVAEKNKKIHALFSKYFNDADYIKEYECCLNGMYTYEECKERFSKLKAEKDANTFNPRKSEAEALNFGDVSDVVYALCLKNGINTKAKDNKNRKLNLRTMTEEQLSVRDLSLGNILLNYINTKRLQNNQPAIEIDNKDSVDVNTGKILNSISQADLSNILSTFTTELWVESDSYYDLTVLLDMLGWVKVIDENKVEIFKNTTPITEAEEIPEYGEFPSMDVAVESKEFRAKKYGLKMSATFETLLNDRFEIFKKSFGLLLEGLKAGFQKAFVKELVKNREHMKMITDVNTVAEALQKVRKEFNNIKDAKGRRILVAPKYIYTTSDSAQAFENYLTTPTDPTQLNPNKPNPWFNGKIYKFEIIADGYLDTTLSEVNNELYQTNKDDVYFIPEGAIRYLSPTPSLKPRILTRSSNFELNQEVGGLVIFGIAFIDPDLIVCVDAKKLLEDKQIPEVKIVNDKAN